MENHLRGLLTSLGIGILIGIIRERKAQEESEAAGIRTHGLIAVLGSSCWILSQQAFLVGFILVGLLVLYSYKNSSKNDPGLTGEISILLTFALSALAIDRTDIAASLGVVVTILIKAKDFIHKLTREILTERELNDGLLLLASVLIILPVLPTHPVDPWNILVLDKIWKIVLLIMVSGMIGHVLKRFFGAKLGFPLAGFLSGLISSTAATIHFGEKVKINSEFTYLAAASTLLANLASFLLLLGVIATSSSEFFKVVGSGLFLGIITLLVFIMIYLKRSFRFKLFTNSEESSVFKITHALTLATLITISSGVAGLIQQFWGEIGVITTSAIIALGELHSAAVGLSQITTEGGSQSVQSLKMGLFFILLTSGVSKSALAYVSGGKKYGILISLGLGGMLVSYLLSLF